MLPANLPFRIGTTSYIIPADILPNARYLADKVHDIQLVLFELDDAQSNLPDSAQILQLKSLAADYDLSFTVHLPLDLKLADSGNAVDISIQKARRVIETTRELHPLAYIVHLDGKTERSSINPDVLGKWQKQAVLSLRQVAEFCGDIRLLAVENLESYPLDFNDMVINAAGSSRCIDIGHLWLDGHDPLNFFPGRIEQTTAMHLHGINDRDHQSLAYMPHEKIDQLFRYLLESNYTGVLTLEIFSEEDFNSSMQCVNDSLKRIRGF
jgi:sugar phosphate isomerase/epimerase